MTAPPTTHAPDGGSIPGALCEEPTGDVSIRENEVDCPECRNASMSLRSRVLEPSLN